MSLNLDRSIWKRVKLGDVVLRSRIQINPVDGGVDRYVAGGHVDTESVIIRRSGDVADGQMGSTFRYLFKPGQVLFVSARPYLRKIGVPDFAGVVADKTYVLDAAPGNGLLHDVLPFLLTSDRFVEYATQEATGSMNPRLLWGAMQRYEFHLPPLDEQKRISALLWAVERLRLVIADESKSAEEARCCWIEAGLPHDLVENPLGEAAAIVSGITLGPARQAMPSTVPYLRVANVQRGSLDLDEIKDVGATAAEIEAKRVRRGDVLVVEGHASVSEIGRAAIWDRDESPLFQNHLFRVRSSADYRPRFLLEWINSERGRAYIRTVAKSTSGLNTINSTVLKAMPVPAATLQQQDELLRVVALVDKGRASLSAEAAGLAHLRSILLAYVFGGN